MDVKTKALTIVKALTEEKAGLRLKQFSAVVTNKSKKQATGNYTYAAPGNQFF